jgi:hypothetical protein
MKCKICAEESAPVFKAKVLYSYDVQYYKCGNCKFIQTERTFWLEEAYHSAITSLDIGYATRNVMFSEIVSSIIKFLFDKKSRFLDFGGGYGLFVRLMRDRGFDYYRQDLFCENIFSTFFDLGDVIRPETKFELLTAFEVFEHLDDPLSEIQTMLGFSDSILFSTELQPHNDLSNASDWWYFVPETGQHVALYNIDTLRFIARKLNLNLYSDYGNLHLLTRKKFRLNYIKYISWAHRNYNGLFSRHFRNRKSHLQADFQFIKSKTTKQEEKQ